MNSNTIKRVVILGALAITGIFAVQSYWVLQTWDLEERQFDQSASIALYRVANSLAKLNDGSLPSQDIVKKISSNYYIVNINDTIDAGELEYFLQQELEAVALHIDFEYGIYDCASDKMLYGAYCGYSLKDQKQAKLSNLPKYDEFTYYFGVKFPTRVSHLAGKMQLSIIFTVLLLIAIFYFIYSIFVILRQKRLSEMQKDFINNMTHEFKTPISTIKISADVFLNSESILKDQRLRQYAHIIQEQNQRLNNQVEKVLQIAKLERSGLELHWNEFDLHQLVTEVSRDTTLRMKEAGGQMKIALHAESPEIKADKLHLTNILFNLIDNAVKYSKKVPEIKITTQNEGSRIRLSVADKGVGIPKNHQQRVFNKFYRVPTGNVHNVKGFGLGLYYINRICKAHGWKVMLESQPGQGTTVHILIQRNRSPRALMDFWSNWKLNPLPKA